MNHLHRAPMERNACLLGICISLKNLIKNALNRKAVKKQCPSLFPKSGAPVEADAHFRALLNISFGVPSEGALPQGPVHGTPHREMPHSQSPHSFVFQSPGIWTPLQIPGSPPF